MCAAVLNSNFIRLTSHRVGKLGTDTKKGQDLWSNAKYLVGWLVGWLVGFYEVVGLCDRLVCVLVGFVDLFVDCHSLCVVRLSSRVWLCLFCFAMVS